jgi:ABC-type phosphate transport system permease subunit
MRRPAEDSAVNALFLIAGTFVGYRWSVLALLVALPLSVAAAVILSLGHLLAPGFTPVIVLCVIFEFGFFAGCVIHSLMLERAEARERLFGKKLGRSR